MYKEAVFLVLKFLLRVTAVEKSVFSNQVFQHSFKAWMKQQLVQFNFTDSTKINELITKRLGFFFLIIAILKINSFPQGHDLYLFLHKSIWI